MCHRKGLPGGESESGRHRKTLKIAMGYLSLLLLMILLACSPSDHLVHEDVNGALPEGGRGSLPPVADFFRKPEKGAFSISPDGNHIAWLALWNNHMNLHVAKFLSINSNPVSLSSAGPAVVDGGAVQRVTDLGRSDIHGYHWIDNDEMAFLADVSGEGHSHLFLVSRTGGVIRDLTPFPGVSVDVVDVLPDRPNEILVAMNQRDPALFDVYRLTISTGQSVKVAENPGNVLQWTADHNGKLRAAIQTDGLRTVLLYRNRETEAFQSVFSGDAHTGIRLHGFAFDNRHLLLVSNIGRDKAALVVFDPITKKETRQLYAHSDVDVLAPLLSRHRGLIEGAVYITDRVRYAFFEERRENVQTAIDRRFPGLQASIADRSRDENRLLILVAGDRNPGAYYAYDALSERMGKLGDLRPWLDSERLAVVEPIAYPAVDGQLIHGYITLPSGTSPRNLPVVVLPHGDPWARDVWGYDPEAQFLASRGYAVFQPNFRGSSGYGRAFKAAGFRQWGTGVMQNDISDGVSWLISEGIADPQRIAICGISYGGYAALAGLTFTPDLYAAGVSYAGPANLITLIQSFPAYRKIDLEKIHMEIGDPRKEVRRLIAASPYFHVDRIRSPLFLAQGAADPRVKKSDIDEIVYRLRRRGIRVFYMVRSNEGESLQHPANRIDFYQAMEAFLARYIGGRSTTPEERLEPLERAH